MCVFTSAGQWLIAINHIQNKSFCVYNKCVYYVYIKTDTYSNILKIFTCKYLYAYNSYYNKYI